MKKVVRIEKGRKVRAMPTQVLRTVLGDGEVESWVEVIQISLSSSLS